MPDEAPAEESNDEATEPGEFDAERAKAKIAKVNGEAANLRKRLKELEPLAKQAQEAADARKSVEERAAEKITAAESRILTAEANVARLEVALEKGLTATQAKRLIGTTKEELAADADDLLASFPAGPAQEAPAGRPKERMRPGAVPSADSTTDMNALIRRGRSL